MRAGNVIAEVGAEGIALGPHLHLEIRTDARDYETTRNPELFLRPLDGCGTIVGRVIDAAGVPAAAVAVGLYAPGVDGAGEWLAETTTYPGRHVNATAPWAENFLFADTPVGRYVVGATVDGVRTSAVVTVTAGAAWLVTLRPATVPTDVATEAPSASRTARVPSATATPRPGTSTLGPAMSIATPARRTRIVTVSPIPRPAPATATEPGT